MSVVQLLLVDRYVSKDETKTGKTRVGKHDCDLDYLTRLTS